MTVEYRRTLPRSELAVEQPQIIRVSEFLVYQSVSNRIMRSLSERFSRRISSNSHTPQYNAVKTLQPTQSSLGTRKRTRSQQPARLLNRLRAKTMQRSQPPRYTTPANIRPELTEHGQLARSEYFTDDKPQQLRNGSRLLKLQAIKSYYDEIRFQKQRKNLAPEYSPVPLSVAASQYDSVRSKLTKENSPLIRQCPSFIESTTSQVQAPKIVNTETTNQAGLANEHTLSFQQQNPQPLSDAQPNPPTKKNHKREPLLRRHRLTSSTTYTSLCASPCT